jgi:processing peptidase subunit alpha
LSRTRLASTSTSSSTLASPPPPQVTTLSNKLRVVTESTPGHFNAVGVYVDAGSRYETKRNSGVSHLMDRLAFKVCESFLCLPNPIPLSCETSS